MMQTARIILAMTCAAVLAGCAGGDTPQLMNIRSTSAGPDEFGILPPKPLEMPTDLAQLPEPTLGGSNRSDPTPEADAIIALGGRPGAGAGLDAGLVNHVSRYGVSAGIRQTLAAEDLQWRRDNNGRVLERLFNVNVYYRAYEDQQLDQHAELWRWRQRGARTPSAPPPKEDE